MSNRSRRKDERKWSGGRRLIKKFKNRIILTGNKCQFIDLLHFMWYILIRDRETSEGVHRVSQNVISFLTLLRKTQSEV